MKPLGRAQARKQGLAFVAIALAATLGFVVGCCEFSGSTAPWFQVVNQSEANLTHIQFHVAAFEHEIVDLRPNSGCEIRAVPKSGDEIAVTYEEVGGGHHEHRAVLLVPLGGGTVRLVVKGNGTVQWKGARSLAEH